MDRVRWTYDRARREIERRVRVDTIGGSTELTVTTGYGAAGRVNLVQATSPAGTWYSFTSPTYALNDELTAFSVVEPGASGAPASNVQHGSYGFTYATDGTRRLVQSARSTDLGGQRTYDWTYDVFGNRLRELRVGVGCVGPDTSLYDGNNLLRRTLSSQCSSTSQFWNDYAGNRLARIDTTGSTCPAGCPQQILSYTAKGELFFSVTPTADQGTYDYNWHWYDGAGLRVVAQVWSAGQNGPYGAVAPSGVKSYYVYDGSNLVLTLVHGTSWWVRSRYLVGGTDDAPLGRFTATGSPGAENLALVGDRQGTTLAAMKANGTQESQVWWCRRTPKFPHLRTGKFPHLAP